MGKLAAIGWVLAALIAGVSYLGYRYLIGEREAALAAQAAEYESRMAKVKADADKMVQKIRDEAAASAQIMQTELDFAKMPDLPLEFAFRRNQVLYVENKTGDEFIVPVKITRPRTGATSEKLFKIQGKAFRDLAALDNWVFESGDQIEFVKEGYKPWKGTFP